MSKVIVRRCEVYDSDIIKSLIDSILSIMPFSLSSGSRVLIKPNLLAIRTPEEAVTTHPSVTQAIAELCIDYSCSVSIGDSPGFGSTERVLKSSGIMDVVNKLDLDVSSFNSRYIKRINGVSPYREFLLGEDPELFDVVINVPKLKTHGMMGLTLGVKNTFGFIHAFDKAKWHFRAGKERSLFASMLIDIHTIVKPSLTILDGIVGMDGDGPSSGRVRQFGLLAASRNAFALDDYIEKLVRFPYPTPVVKTALQHQLIPEYESFNQDVPEVTDLLLPRSMQTDWPMPDFARKALRTILIKKPKVKKSLCKACNVCVQVCPSAALIMGRTKPVFDYTRCIRCYCCQELCPQKAIFVR